MMSGNHLTPRVFVAKEIRTARAAKGMTPASLAKALFVSESLVRAWEAGRRLPKPEVIGNLETTLDTGGWLTKIVKELVNASVPLEWFGRWPEIENRTTSLWSVQTTVVPGLLQTEEYAREVLRAAHHIADPEEMVASRLDRQQVLFKEDPPMLVVLLQESVLRHNVGGPKVMADQLDHLARMAVEHENIILHIIPDRARACAIMIAPFVIASIDGENDVAYVDNQLNGEVIEDVEEVGRLRRMFDILRADAMNRDDSLELIREVAEQWKS